MNLRNLLFALPLILLFTSCDDEFASNEGTVTFWTNRPAIHGINIFVEGTLEGSLTTYFTDFTPNCNEGGTLSLDLPPGNYTYTAVQPSLYQWNGAFTIERSTCTRELLN